MKLNEYLTRAADALDSGRISPEAYDAMVMNASVFCDDDEDDDEMDERLPGGYIEIEYDDPDTPEAVAGMRFDDLNYQRYMER